MDLSLYDLRDRLRKTLESRIPSLSKRTQAARLPRGVAILAIALGLGVWANQGSREEGRLKWLRENPPALETWKTILSRRGFGPIEDPEWREKAFLEMPDIARKSASAMISEDHTVFVLRSESDWLYFGLAARNGAGGQVVRRALWEPLGLGWEAVSRFDVLSLPDFSVSRPKTRNSGEDSDPRRLDY